MSLIQMSVTGGILIMAVIVLRALCLSRLPKGTFLALWAVAVLRLVLPFSIPSPASVYNLAEQVQTQESAPAGDLSAVLPLGGLAPDAVPDAPAAVSSPVPEDRYWVSPNDRSGSVFAAVWLAGTAVCGTFFLAAYLHCRKEFRTALPVEDQRLEAWLKAQNLRRAVSLRQSDQVDAPLTYGLLRPVILLPKGWESEPRLDYVLEHELTHIRHLDALWKLVLAATACAHWFNPLAWCMYVLANRDIELRCDETVVRRLGLESRSGYALALISLEEKKSGLGPFASAFSRNAIEERIFAIMKLKKRSLAAILAAVVLVCCVGVSFATSAADKTDTPYPIARDGVFTKEELDQLASLWFEGWADMTVTEYQQKMWTEFDTPEMISLIDRYGQYSAANPEDSGLARQYDQSSAAGTDFNSLVETMQSRSFYDYFHQVFEPLTAHNWQERIFSSEAWAQTEDGGSVLVEYNYTMHILDPDALTAGDYQRKIWYTEASMERVAQLNPPEDHLANMHAMLTSAAPDEALQVSVTCSSRVFAQPTVSDADLHAQASRESAREWDRVLSPYASFGLTWEFDDPDLDGNGLTMWFNGKEVRSIYDRQEGIWITEHTGNSFPADSVDLETVYTDGVLSGLRKIAEDKQEIFDRLRDNNGIYVESFGKESAATDTVPEESREFPRATLEDYDALMTLRTFEPENLPSHASSVYPDARSLSLEVFNQRLLDWANENPDAWNRINCDVIWNDYDKELTTDARTFAFVTCYFSGIENGQMIRALYTGGSEQDPGWSRSLPEKFTEENGIRTAWCDLYYDISYHISDKSAVTAQERDACVGGMMNAISIFWRDTDLDILLTMTEEDVVSRFNAWAEESSTENVRINPITTDNIHFETCDERGID